jgi:hypothetical protein
MQLTTRPSRARRRLIAASCALLGASGARGQEALDNGDASTGSTVIDSALAYYHEDNGRIQAIEPVVNLRHDYGDGRLLTLNFTYDSLSGSTPNGALTSNQPQTFSAPSGGNTGGVAPGAYAKSSEQEGSGGSTTYTVQPGELPMDPNFHDQRAAFGANYQLPLSRLTHLNFGGDVSYERDFLSTSANVSMAHDFNQKNTTLSFGVSGEFDSLSPIGGTPVAGSDYALLEKTGGGKSKNDAGLLLSITQVMNRRWISELNLSMDRATGYLNDPYKIVSVIDPSGATAGYLYEKRPDTRTRNVAYWENRVAFDRAAASLSLRYMTDDWGIHSDTANLSVRWSNSSRSQYLEPSVRWYQQTAANFYTPWIDNTALQSIDNASADYRLGAFHAISYGLKYALKMPDDLGNNGSEFSVRLEYYQQTADNQAPGPGSLQNLNLYPGLSSVMLQFGYRFGF